MPRLVSSAIKFRNTNSEYFDVMCGKRHADILHRMFLMRIDYDRNTALETVKLIVKLGYDIKKL